MSQQEESLLSIDVKLKTCALWQLEELVSSHYNEIYHFMFAYQIWEGKQILLNPSLLSLAIICLILANLCFPSTQKDTFVIILFICFTRTTCKNNNNL